MMSLFHYDPWGFDEIDRFFDDAFGVRWAVVSGGSSQRQRGNQMSERFFKPKFVLFLFFYCITLVHAGDY